MKTTAANTKRDWAGRALVDGPIAYCNNTNQNVDIAHKAIMAAIANNGVFDEDFADIFVLTRTSAGMWVVDFA